MSISQSKGIVMEQNKHSQQLLQAGPLKSTLTLKLHTSYAIRLWEGRVVPNSQNDGDEKSVNG
ncbi:AcaB family transcriptional regulator [Escherichia coli]